MSIPTALAMHLGQPLATLAPNGVEVITDTAAHAVECSGIYCLTDCVIAAATTPLKTGNTLVAVTLPSRFFVPLHFTSITLTSGTALGVKV